MPITLKSYSQLTMSYWKRGIMNKKISDQLVKFLIIGLVAAFLFIAINGIYTLIIMRWAINQGTYPTAEQGMIQRANTYYEEIEKIEIKYAGPNCIDGKQPHVWYVIARIWAESKLGEFTEFFIELPIE